MAAMIGASKGRTIGTFGKEAAGRSNSAELLNKSPGRSRYATPGRPLIVDLMAFDTQWGIAAKEDGLVANFV